jgi:hypothetical protein
MEKFTVFIICVRDKDETGEHPMVNDFNLTGRLSRKEIT